jgi:hypothetical protein
VTTDQIQQIIDALKSAAGGGWQALVSQQLSTGWVGLGIAAFFAFVFIIAIAIFGVSLRKTDWNDVITANVVCVISGFVALFSIIFAVTLAAIDINQVINPNGAAIQQLVGGL